MLELYHWEPNGAHLKPLIVLHEKGLAFHSRYVDVLAFEQHRPGFLELIADSRRKVALGVRRIEDALAHSDWLVDGRYSLADIDAFAICNALTVLTPDLVGASAAPRLFGWLERMRARPAVRSALSLSRTGRPEEAFAPGPEHSRWG